MEFAHGDGGGEHAHDDGGGKHLQGNGGAHGQGNFGQHPQQLVHAQGNAKALVYRDNYLSWRGLLHRVDRRTGPVQDPGRDRLSGAAR